MGKATIDAAVGGVVAAGGAVTAQGFWALRNTAKSRRSRHRHSENNRDGNRVPREPQGYVELLVRLANRWNPRKQRRQCELNRDVRYYGQREHGGSGSRKPPKQHQYYG